MGSLLGQATLPAASGPAAPSPGAWFVCIGLVVGVVVLMLVVKLLWVRMVAKSARKGWESGGPKRPLRH
jgi:hypothetical protein